ncbi:hypothetical protein QM637_02870 [Pantoea allii]|uniref:DUF7683 domain-containing protein n=1 Tax=Pantoea allii TaxID=574096 RepID=UPI001F4DA021|nr:hypothetical protein [Pantoea allii]MCH9300407.1 hypothetical protein [Pantoea allii]MDJ0034788.1 hypothetical protein [Pantoea allii]
MIVYTIDIYSKETEDLILEINISPEKADEIIDILELNAEDREEFMQGIGVYNLKKNQALRLELLVGENFYSDDVILQISGGEV